MATLTVRGHGVALGRPDEVRVVLVVSSYGGDPGAAYDEAAQRAQELEAVLGGVGVRRVPRRARLGGRAGSIHTGEGGVVRAGVRVVDARRRGRRRRNGRPGRHLRAGSRMNVRIDRRRLVDWASRAIATPSLTGSE